MSSQGKKVRLEQRGGEAMKNDRAAQGSSSHEGGNVVLIAAAQWGSGEAELGRLLLRNFLNTLKEVEPRPAAILFVNEGVKLTVEGSPLLEVIGELSTHGVEILSCGTCLDYYHLKEKVRAGRITNMHDIVTRLSNAKRVIRP